MRGREALLVIVAAIGCAADVRESDAGRVHVAPHLYNEAGEPVIGRLKTIEGITELTASTFANDERGLREAWAKRKVDHEARVIELGAVLDADLDRSLLRPVHDDALRGTLGENRAHRLSAEP